MVGSRRKADFPDSLILPTAPLLKEFRENTAGLGTTEASLLEIINEVMMAITVDGEDQFRLALSLRRLPQPGRVDMTELDCQEAEYLKGHVASLGMAIFRLIEQLGCFSPVDAPDGRRVFRYIFDRLVGDDMILRVPAYLGVRTPR